MVEDRKVRTPLFSIVKRDDLPKYKAIIIRIATFIATFFFAMLICFFVIKENYFEIIGTLFKGATVVSKGKILPWRLLMDTALLLAFAIAIVAPFKMKYWNMGANGQVLVGALAAIVVMFFMEDFAVKSTFNNVIVIILMLLASILASVIWAVIPAIFKVFFKTNETLFTLMMNYVASGLVGYVNYVLAQGKKESPGIVNADSQAGWFPVIVDKYFLPIIIILLITVVIYFYIKKTKHGYEISVVGDSINTAKYVGMNTKKIIIRTLIVSGIICGIIGFIYSSAINHSIDPNTCGSLGFTAVLVAWLSNFSPIIIAGISFVLSFLTLGTSKVSSTYRLGNNDLSNVIIGLIFFAILICEFFIRFKLKFNQENNMYKAIKKLFSKKRKGGVEEC
ncbi:MAG: ABC transporter permease [Bacilli bacterium]|nr:ABC transporter permease [Bacilli bacterium]